MTGVDPPATASNDAAIRGSVATARLVVFEYAVVIGGVGGTKAEHPPKKRMMAAVLADGLVIVDNVVDGSDESDGGLVSLLVV